MADADAAAEASAGARAGARRGSAVSAEAPVDELSKLQLELDGLRAKVASGAKLSGKEKRNLKKLEDAAERWKEYEGCAGGGVDDDVGVIGSQFSAQSTGGGGGGGRPEARSMGDGLLVEVIIN